MASLINFAILNVVIYQYVTNIDKEKGGLFWKTKYQNALAATLTG